MQEYSSDQEQIDAIKKWLRENGMAIALGLVVGFGGLYGWKSWQSYQNRQAEQASSIYSQILVSLDSKQLQGIPKATDELIKNYSKTAYASLAALAAAKVAAVSSNYEVAKERLQWVIDNSDQVQLVPLATVRLARLYILENNAESAASLLEGKSFPDSYAARVAELKGDLNVLRGENALARDAYNQALSAELPVQNREMIQIKLDALKVSATEPAKEESEATTGAAE